MIEGELADAFEAWVGDSEGVQHAVVELHEVAEVLGCGFLGGVEIRVGEEFVRGFGDLVDCIE